VSSEQQQPEGRLPPVDARTKTRDFPGVASDELAQELLRRVRAGEPVHEDLAGALSVYLDANCDGHENRFGARRLRDLFSMFCGIAAGQLRFDGVTVVDLGCGARNPLAMLTVFLLAGAKRGIGVDLDEVQDLGLAVRGIAKSASLMMLEPRMIVGRYPLSRSEVVQNAGGFDFAKLFAGDASGIPESRLSLRRESIHQLQLADGEVDLVVSNSFFEHVPDPAGAVRQLARITKPGGHGVHNIDCVDHRIYREPERHPLDFLREESDAPLVLGSNRVRPLQFFDLFEQNGFEVLERHRLYEVSVTPEMRQRFAEPFRSLPDEVLRWARGQVFVRRK